MTYHVHSFNDIVSIDGLTNLQDGQILVYNAATGLWENRTGGGGGGGPQFNIDGGRADSIYEPPPTTDGGNAAGV